MADYTLTERAEAELFEIAVYGYRHFGIRQAEAYAGALDNAFQLLAVNPRMGRAADVIGVGVRRHECGSHVILYEPVPDGVLILAVVHSKSVRRLKL